MQPGARLGPYQIVSRLGAGGMGEVWRALDTRLDRAVAVKILPPEFAQNAHLKLRLDREAKTISQLEHPHICRLYDVGENYLVMELLEGESLAERLSRGPLPLSKVIEYGSQVAEALDRAHRAGVIHRDLKPGNIMITKSGAKLLDFGLAKSDQALGVTAEGATEHKPLTQEGMILGTFQYMAPEIIEAGEATARSDVFALGLVLYEMATGRPAFSGKTKASLIAAILEREPAPVSDLQPSAPAALDHIIRRCLAKDPDDRYQTPHDVALELRWIGETISQPQTAVDRDTRPRRSLLLASAIALAMIAIAAAAWSYRNRAVPARAVAQRLDLQPPDGLAITESVAPATLAISPDGQWVAFSATGENGGLFVRSTREIEARRIGEGNTPFFSPDGKWLGFFSDGALQKVRLAGGDPEKICAVARLRGASWGDDGKILFSSGEGLLLVSADGGEPEPVTTPKSPERHYWPHFLPGGTTALFVVHAGGSDSFRTIATISLNDRTIQPLFKGTAPYFSGGHLVYSHLGTIHAVKFDPETGRTTGKPTTIFDDVFFYAGSGFTAFALSRSGAAAYVPGAPKPFDHQLTWVDRSGTLVPAGTSKASHVRPVLSPDAKLVALEVETSRDGTDLWIEEMERGGLVRLTYGARAIAPVWSPDQQWIYFASGVSGQFDVYRVRSDGSGKPQQLTNTIDWEYPGGVSADGANVLIMKQIQASQWDLMTIAADGSGTAKPFLSTPALEAWPNLSPDRRWVAYESFETGDREIHVRRFPESGARITVSTGGGICPFWGPDGREIFYRREDEVWVVPVSAGARFTVGKPKMLFKAEGLRLGWTGGWSVSPDGQKILAVRLAEAAKKSRRLVYIPNLGDEIEDALD